MEPEKDGDEKIVTEILPSPGEVRRGRCGDAGVGVNRMVDRRRRAKPVRGGNALPFLGSTHLGCRRQMITIQTLVWVRLVRDNGPFYFADFHEKEC